MHHWYLVHTKIRQEKTALASLERQGYTCFMPLLKVEKLLGGVQVALLEALFPRYLFIRLSPALSEQWWAPIRSTQGVNRLVALGPTPARVDPTLVEQLRRRSASDASQLQPLEQNRAVGLTKVPFIDLEALYLIKDGAGRAMVLLTFLSQQVPTTFNPAAINHNG